MSAKRTGKPSKASDAPLRGRADLRRLERVGEREIMRTSPEDLAGLPDDFWDEAELVIPVAKRAISLRVDEDVLRWFRGLGPRYQTRMNAVLQSFMTRAARSPRPRTRQRRGAA